MPPVRISSRAYPHRAGLRFRLSGGPGQHKWGPVGRTEQEARELARIQVAAYKAQLGLTVAELSERYLELLRALGRKSASLAAVRSKLRLLVGAQLDGPAAMAEPLARSLYAELTGKCAAATHREALRAARSCYRWAVEEGLVKLNPWAGVRPVGKARRGKPQLTIDEARRLAEHCRGRLHEDGALVVLLALLCGLRCSEIVERTVRDVDDNGRLLRIADSKTAAGRRLLELPAELLDAVAARCRARKPDEPLLPRVARLAGSARQWASREVKRYCAAAGVRVVCAHALRGQFASLAYEAAAMPHLVAAALGHACSAVTERHYADRGAVQRAAQRERLAVLQGSRRSG